MRLPLESRVGCVNLWSWPRSTKLSRDILLNVKIVVANGGELVSKLGEIFDGLFDPVGGHVVSSRLSAQAEVIAEVLFEGAVCVVSANDRIGQIQILDDRSEAFPCSTW